MPRQFVRAQISRGDRAGIIGETDARNRKFELDSINPCLYRLRIRERTAHRTTAARGSLVS